MGKMTSKEFDLLVSLVLAMLKEGKTDEVIRLLEESKSKK